MRIAVCDDDEQESAFLSKMIKEYQLSRGGVLTASFFIMVRIFCVTGRAGNTTLFC